jgi:hypothetical protein
MTQQRIIILLCVLTLIGSACIFVPQVSAQEMQQLTCQPSYTAARRADMVCRGAWEGTVSVFNRSQQVDQTKPWQENISQTDAIWIFDTRPANARKLDGNAALIIDFSPQGQGLRADIYDDQNNSGAVSYTTSADTEPQITENTAGLPTIRVTASEPWWQRESNLNYNIAITVDGPVRGDFVSSVSRYFDQFKTDSVIDFTIDVYDNNRDGIADYELRDSPVKGNYVHTSVTVSNETARTPMQGVLLWPFLSVGEWGYDQTYNSLKPPLQVNWNKRKIVIVGEFVPSRGRSSNWFTYSINRTLKGQENLTNFESPFAFYDLSGVGDGYPDLQVRFERYNPGEFVQHFDEPIQSVRYSWDQYHRQNWDYKVDLLGRHVITTSLQLNDRSIQTIPYAEIPTWVTQRSWDQVNFIAYEGQGRYYSSEGIYEWAAQGDTRQFYITGDADGYEAKELRTIAAGFRGEYRIAPETEPRLYASNVDGKLHLFGAQGGVWNINDFSAMHYHDINADGYIDQWTHTSVVDGTQPITLTQQLNLSTSHLILSEGNNVRIREAVVEPVVFEALPPTDKQSWESLGMRLAAAERDLEVGELEPMLEQFAGPDVQIKGASLREYRSLHNGGFRFLLDLRPGFSVAGEPLLDVGSLEPGTYVVIYNGTFAIAPLTPAAITATAAARSATQGQASGIQIVLQNKGLADLRGATIELLASAPDGQANVVANQVVTVLSEETVTATLEWTPTREGAWTITPRMSTPDGEVLSFEPVEVTAQPAPEANPPSVLSVSAAGRIPFVALVLFAFASLITVVVWQQVGHKKQVDDAA